MFPNYDTISLDPPTALTSIERDTKDSGFDMPSVRETGALLRYLGAAKPRARVLELGTGTGLATCWLLDGLDRDSSLTTIDNDEEVLRTARRHIGNDSRLTILNEDAEFYLEKTSEDEFDIIFADAWPGKFSHLDQALSRLAQGGLYVVDDLLPQSNWPDNHAGRVPIFIEALKSKPELSVEYREWASGILIAKRN